MCIGIRYCFIVAATLAALSVALPPASHAQADLFEEVSAQPLSPEQSRQLSSLQHRPTTAEVRTVRFASLAPLSQGRAVTLNVVPGTRFTAENKKVKRISDSTFTWIGEPSGAPGMIVLAVRGDRVTGTIRRDGRLFKVQSLGGGDLHAVVRVDESKFPPEHPPGFDGGSYDTDDGDGGRPRSDNPDAQGNHFQTSSSSSGGEANIRVLVAYTDSAEAAAGDIDGLVQTAIAETNQSYRMSNISASDASVTLAAARNVAYQEDGRSYYDHRDFLQDPNDGELDIVHTWRDDYYADVVVLLVEDRGACGIAYKIYATFASQAFAVVNRDCATGNYSFGHEIGHLQGARHNPEADPSVQPFSYGHGYLNPGDEWRTVMAVPSPKFCPNGCERIQYWSNPYVSYEGDPTGTAAEEDNAQVLRETSDEIAAFRPTPLNVTLSGPSRLDSYETGTWTANASGGIGSISYFWEVNQTWSSTWSDAYCSGTSCSYSFINTCDWTRTAQIRVIATSHSQADTSSQAVQVSGSGGTLTAGTVEPNAPPCPSEDPDPIVASKAAQGVGLAGISLQAKPAEGREVFLSWQAGGSALQAPVTVQHRTDSTAAWTDLGVVRPADSVETGAEEGPAYQFRADRLDPGSHQFRLATAAPGPAKQSMRATQAVSATVEMNEAYRLEVYPNPVREQATVELAVKERQDPGSSPGQGVTVTVYDVLGRQVTTLYDGRLPAQETNRLSLDAAGLGLSSGTYVVRVEGERFVATKRLTVVR